MLGWGLGWSNTRTHIYTTVRLPYRSRFHIWVLLCTSYVSSCSWNPKVSTQVSTQISLIHSRPDISREPDNNNNKRLTLPFLDSSLLVQPKNKIYLVRPEGKCTTLDIISIDVKGPKGHDIEGPPKSVTFSVHWLTFSLLWSHKYKRGGKTYKGWVWVRERQHGGHRRRPGVPKSRKVWRDGT